MRAPASSPSPSPRGRPRRQRLDKHQVLGLSEVRLAADLLRSLRAAYDHPNRVLFLDDLLIALLLAFFNPVIRSLRGLEDASQMPGLNQYLDVAAIKRSTASDALATFDPELLRPLLVQLRQQVTPGQLDATEPTLRGLLNRLLAFDGSFFRTACDVGWALRERHGAKGVLRGRVRLNLHLAVRDGLPTGVSLAGAGDPGEPLALLETVEPGQIVVADRGCFSHETVHQLRQRKADFVLRLQSGVRCEVIAERPLTDADRAAGVLHDQTVLLTGAKNPYSPTPLRLVTIQPQGDSTREGGTAARVPGPIRLLTSLQEEVVAAWMIGHLYRRRWEVELFFRWLKCCAQWEHLLSESRPGMQMQFYVAVLGTLLLAAYSGRRPDRYGYTLLCLVAAGQGSLDNALEILQRRQAERDRDRQRRQQRQASRNA